MGAQQDSLYPNWIAEYIAFKVHKKWTFFLFVLEFRHIFNITMSISVYYIALNVIVYQTFISTIQYQIIVFGGFFVVYGIFWGTTTSIFSSSSKK